MNYENDSFISNPGLYFRGILHDIKKSRLALQPIFEAITNSIESIKIRQKSEEIVGTISVTIRHTLRTDESSEFDSIIIADNGIGFNETEFTRFNTFKDFTKGFKNLGSGRIQFAHHFKKTRVISRFKVDDKTMEREFYVSKNPDFLDKNAIVFHKCLKEIHSAEIETRVEFFEIIDNSKIYNELSNEVLKTSLLERYINYFCQNKSSLPIIKIINIIGGVESGVSIIDKSDIPDFDKKSEVTLNYWAPDPQTGIICKVDKSEKFEISAFKIQKHLLSENGLNFVSKGELVDGDYIQLEGLPSTEHVNGNRYLFLVSSDYIDQRDSNLRGELKIFSREEYIKSLNMLSGPEIFTDDMQAAINLNIKSMYAEIETAVNDHTAQIQKLKEMFLLSEDDAQSVKISINDTEEKILEKFYASEAKKVAKIDSEIKVSVDNIEKLNPNSRDYGEKLRKEVDNLIKTIPMQNKNSLTQYVARRQLVLELFAKVLARNLEVQVSSERNVDESLIHNILFQQGSNDAESSDLWLLNEDFIYFKGNSESRLVDMEINGKKIFKNEFNNEEEEYIKSLGENRSFKRPDILLFPEEGKCIIIELKRPDENVANHLTQINLYASLIRNHTIDSVEILAFYGYLIGESIEPRDVMGRVSNFEVSYELGYLFRPSEKVQHFNGGKNGSLYTEVLKYSTLLEKARRRNKIFLDKIISAKSK